MLSSDSLKLASRIVDQLSYRTLLTTKVQVQKLRQTTLQIYDNSNGEFCRKITVHDHEINLKIESEITDHKSIKSRNEYYKPLNHRVELIIA